MKLSYPDPRLRHLSFEYPGSAGAGPRHISLTKTVFLYNLWRIKVENLLSVDMLFPKERIEEMSENGFCLFKLSDKIKLVFPPWKGVQ